MGAAFLMSGRMERNVCVGVRTDFSNFRTLSRAPALKHCNSFGFDMRAFCVCVCQCAALQSSLLEPHDDGVVCCNVSVVCLNKAPCTNVRVCVCVRAFPGR